MRCSLLDWRDFSGIPNTFWDTDLKRLSCVSQIAAVQSWIDERGQPGLMLHGATSGTGKTRLGTIAFNRRCAWYWQGRDEERRNVQSGDANITGLWFNVNGFRNCYSRVMRDSEAKAHWQSQLSTNETLFIDDVDKLKPTEGLMELVFAVLDERLTNSRATILTTNLTGNTLAQRWGDEVGPYLVRRIRDYSLTVGFDVWRKSLAVKVSDSF